MRHRPRFESTTIRENSVHPRALTASLIAAIVALTAAAPSPTPQVTDNAILAIDWTLTPTQIKVSCAQAIATANTAIGRIVSVPVRGRTFATVVAPLEAAFADLNDRTAAQQFLYNVSTSAPVRDASNACSTQIGNFASEATARPDLYLALAAAQSSKTASGDAQMKITDLWAIAARRAGAGLSDQKRRQFVALNKRLTVLQNAFAANLGNDQTTIVLPSALVAGLPNDFTAGLKTNPAGSSIVPVNESTYPTFMQNASVSSARKQMYFAYENRAATKNVALLEQAIGVRDSLAHLFGYPTWAAYVLADRMAQTPTRVNDFLKQIDTAILPKARSEFATLAALNGGTLQPWDERFVENNLRKSKYAVDTNAIRQYFPLQHTIDSVLTIYSKLLGVQFTRVAQPNDWNGEVLNYTVADTATGKLIGTFYLDLYPRPGKYDHFANFPLVTRRVLPDGNVRAPIAAIVGNWPRPAAGKPALLSHDDVETFFHEFGHNMAAMLANEPYETLTNGFRQDFVEAPSQMLENWVWDPAILKELSSNLTTGAPLPDDLIAKMIAARYFDYSLSTTQQILYASVDMAYHTAGRRVDTTATWKRIQEAVTPNQFVAGTHPQASFGHLMGGYDAGYYGYQWSKVYAQDMFTAFQSAGLENAAIGMKYRTDVLAPARTYEPDAEVAKLLGRPMSPNAFYQELGIVPPAP